MNCPKCNEKIKLTDSTCPYCGFSFEEKAETSNTNLAQSYSENKKNDDCNHCKNDYLNNDYPSWVKDIIVNTQKQKKILLIVLAIMATVVSFMFINAIISTFNFAVLVPMIFMLAVFFFITIGTLKTPNYVIKEYQGHIIVAYNNGKFIRVVIDNKQYEDIFTQSLQDLRKIQINGTDIVFSVIRTFNEFKIEIDGE